MPMTFAARMTTRAGCVPSSTRWPASPMCRPVNGPTGCSTDHGGDDETLFLIESVIDPHLLASLPRERWLYDTGRVHYCRERTAAESAAARSHRHLATSH